MGAMIIGMITGTVAMFVIFVSMVVCGVVLALIAHKLKMNAFWWGIAGFLLNYYTVIVFVITVIVIHTRKCPSCKAKVKADESFCSSCGGEIKRIDDKRVVKTYLKVVAIGFIVLNILGAIWLIDVEGLAMGIFPWKESLIFSAALGIAGYIFAKRKNKNKWIFTLSGIAIPWAECAFIWLLNYVINVLNVFNL